MFNLLFTYYKYLKLSINLILFIYIYKYFFDRCNERVLIKQKKSNKSKYVTKSKILLSFIYFVLLFLIYSSMSLNVLYISSLIVSLGSVLFIDNFNSELIDYIAIFDKNKSLRLVWKIFYTIINE